MNTIETPRIALLGICDKVVITNLNSDPLFNFSNIYGLKTFVNSYIFPFPLQDKEILLGIYNPITLEKAEIRIADDLNTEIAKTTVQIQKINGEQIAKIHQENQARTFGLPEYPAWLIYSIKFNGLISEPGQYKIQVNTIDDKWTDLGRFIFNYIPKPDLSEDEIATIKSDPSATKTVNIGIRCKNCQAGLFVYSSIERKKEQEPQYTWYKELPESFECTCKKIRFECKYIKENLHAFLGSKGKVSNLFSLI